MCLQCWMDRGRLRARLYIMGKIIGFFLFNQTILIAICLNVTCVNGQCTAPETCTCSGNWAGVNCTSCATGWEAKNCSTPICSAGCDHGTCKTPNTCDCLTHWTGNLCNFCDDGWEDTDCNTGLNALGTLRLTSIIVIVFSDLQGGLSKRNLCECPRNMQVQRPLWWWIMWQMWRWMAGWFLWHRLIEFFVPIFSLINEEFHQLYARLAVKMETAQSQARVCATQDGMESTVPSVSEFYCQYNCDLNESADIHCNDSTGIGSFALVRHIGTGSIWHSATFDRFFTCWGVLSSIGSFGRDNLVGTAVYGVYASDPLASTAFSVGFTAFKSTPILFMTGDYSQKLVLQYGDILMSTNASAVNVTPITYSTNCKFWTNFSTLSLSFCSVSLSKHLLFSWTVQLRHKIQPLHSISSLWILFMVCYWPWYDLLFVSWKIQF